MGTVAINRKRSEESLNFPFRHSPYLQASKKRRFSTIETMSEDDSRKPPSSSSYSNPTISRISRYPVAKAPIRREIHAPCRGTLRYGSSKAKAICYLKKEEEEEEEIARGDLFFRGYDIAKRTALKGLRFVEKGEDFINLVDENDKEEEDTCIEVVDCDVEKSIEKEKEKKIQPCSLRVDDDTSTMMDSLSLGREVMAATESDASSLEAYKKLLQSAERRDSKLEALGFEIVLHEKRLSQLRQSRPKPLEKRIEVPREPFIPLTEEEEAEVYRAISGRNRRKVLATHGNSNIDITGEILQCLTPTSWLNDEVINVYLELLKERETREPKKYLKCHFFNTFFYKKLASESGYNYKAVRRWTTQRKLGYALLDCDMIFVPIHRGVHWTLAVINNRDRKFLYLDSLNGVDKKILNALAKYLGDEAKEKSGKDIDVSSWDMEFVEDLPQQQNGYDCGVFMLKYIDFFSRGHGLCFSQEHMPYFRLRTAKEILRLRAD